ncbi:MAG TPA: DUF3810 domain-containing protein [Candidatus Merdivicinus intestinavium]|nr:DUF3810 domain-containing protein [Candidatus Merdivicinus intestinavium]
MAHFAESARSFARSCRGRLIWLAAAAGIVLLYFLLRPWTAGMDFLIRYVTTPWKRGMSWACSLLPFSAAELCWALLILGVPVFITLTAVQIVRRKGGRLVLLFRRLSLLAAAAVSIYAGVCLLWGVNYYGKNFSDQSGLAAAPVSADQLEQAAVLFAGLVNESAGSVERDENGLFCVSRESILEDYYDLYDKIAEEYPFLGRNLPQPKLMFFSRLMSILDFTGFFFPFTGEANLNADSPAAFFPSTLAHEMAHQKNIAPEQEANFVAVVTCIRSGKPAYVYSGALLGYVHLANALYEADRTRWEAVSELLCAEARADLSANNAYWAQFESPVSDAVQSVYSSFLQSNGQELGMKSYGACVDLLVAYFIGG